MLRYEQIINGEWVKPVMKDYRMRCCDCSLIHRLEFRVIRWGRGHKVIFRAWRDERATARARKKHPRVKR